MPENIITPHDVDTIQRKWGIDCQLDIVMEECAELIVELARIRGYPDIVIKAETIKRRMKVARIGKSNVVSRSLPISIRDSVAEEVTDVHIMLEQLIMMFDLDAKFRELHEKKYKRLRDRLDK